MKEPFGSESRDWAFAGALSLLTLATMLVPYPASVIPAMLVLLLCAGGTFWWRGRRRAPGSTDARAVRRIQQILLIGGGLPLLLVGLWGYATGGDATLLWTLLPLALMLGIVGTLVVHTVAGTLAVEWLMVGVGSVMIGGVAAAVDLVYAP